MDLTLNLTHGCNLACTYCYAGVKAAERVMSFDTGRRGLLLALDRVRDGHLDVAFFGGEPLLEVPLLLRLADEARTLASERRVRLGLSVTTNGLLLDAATARELDARGFHVALSIDGVAAAQDATRPDVGGGRSSPRVARALDLAVAHLRKLTTISVVDPLTVRLVPEGVAHLVERGVRRVTLNPNWSARWPAREREAWRAAYEAVARLWQERHRAGAPFVASTIDPRIWQRVLGGSAGRCGFGREELAVAPSGRLYACGRIVGDDPEDASRRKACLGDVGCGLDAAACGALPSREDPPECRACALRDRCNRGCGCASLEAGGDGAPSGLLCWHERMSIPIADHAAATLYAERSPSFLTRFYGPLAAVPA